MTIQKNQNWQKTSKRSLFSGIAGAILLILAWTKMLPGTIRKIFKTVVINSITKPKNNEKIPKDVSIKIFALKIISKAKITSKKNITLAANLLTFFFILQFIF